MRPPRIAAEYVQPSRQTIGGFSGFNEAAANRGGIPHILLRLMRLWLRFNEAAANRGGIPGRARVRLRGHAIASMRPPRIAAEYELWLFDATVTMELQ